MRRAVIFLTVHLALLSSLALADTMTVRTPDVPTQRQAVGWVERATLLPEKLLLDAKLAPSIASSVLHAEKLKIFSRKGARYIRFKLQDREGKEIVLERPIAHEKRFKSADGSRSSKPMVVVEICVAGEKLAAEVMLADRSNLDQELRIGRDVLAGRFLVDPSKTNTSDPDCT